MGNSEFTDTSDYIDVKAGQNIVISHEDDTITRSICIYDENKNVIDGKGSVKSPYLYKVTQDGFIRFGYPTRKKG